MMEKFGLPESEEFGVLEVNPAQGALFGRIIRKSQQNVQRLNSETKELTAEPVEKVTVYPFGVRPAAEVLEVYAGSAAAIEQLGVFFSSCLGLSTVVETIELDVVAAIDKLMKTTAKFQLRSVRVSDYSHNSYMTGPYAPKFLDSAHAQEFLTEYAQAVTSAGVRFQTQTGKAAVTLTPKACFSYSCNEDDQPMVQGILRKLV
jgi:hypothetical protein